MELFFFWLLHVWMYFSLRERDAARGAELLYILLNTPLVLFLGPKRHKAVAYLKRVERGSPSKSSCEMSAFTRSVGIGSTESCQSGTDKEQIKRTRGGWWW